MIERTQISEYFDTKAEIESEALKLLPLYGAVHGWTGIDLPGWKVFHVSPRYIYLWRKGKKMSLGEVRIPTRLLWDIELQDTLLQVMYVRSRERMWRREAIRNFRRSQKTEKAVNASLDSVVVPGWITDPPIFATEQPTFTRIAGR